jgi:hypothetical protein
MARPMQLIGTGSPKEDIVAKLIRTALLIGLAAAWRPDAAAGQYSWSNFSVGVGFGTGSARLGIGASYTAVDPRDDFYFEDPCWDYAYYEWYRHACHRGFDRIHLRQNYSVVSVNRFRSPRRRSYYRPYGYSSYTHFSLSFGLSIGYGYPSAYYGSRYYAPLYPTYWYPTYGYAAYGYQPYGYSAYGYSAYRYPEYGYPAYGYPEYGVVRYRGNRTASARIRPAAVYRSPPPVRSTPLYKESPRAAVQRTTAASSVTTGRTTAARPDTDRRTRASSALSSVRQRPTQPQRRGTIVAAAAVPRGTTAPTDGLSARRGTSTRVYPPSRATTSRPSTSSSRAPNSATGRNTPTPSAAPEQPSRAPTSDRARTVSPTRAAPRPTDRSRPGAVTRSLSSRQQMQVTRSAPSATPRASSRPPASTASPSRSRAIQPSARPAPGRAAPRAPATRSAAPRTTTPRPRASSGGASGGAARARATAPARGRSVRRPPR